MPLHIGKGRNISTAIADIVDYVKNPQKTDQGKFIYGYECDTRIADVSVAWQGYTGWQRNGDRPMVVRADIGFHAGKFRPLIAYEYGIRDYPFHHIRAGLGYIF